MDLDGVALAQQLRAEFASEVDGLLREGRRPRLVALQVGTNPATEAYIRGQRRGAEAWRIQYDLHTLPGDAWEAEVRAALETLNASPAVTGILLQLPLPPHLPGRVLPLAIAPEKDVEGVTPTGSASRGAAPRPTRSSPTTGTSSSTACPAARRRRCRCPAAAAR